MRRHAHTEDPAAATPEAGSTSPSSRRRSACTLARHSPWLAAQPASFADGLLAAARLRDHAAGSVVINAQGEERSLHFLVHGSVRVSVPRPHQELSLAHILLPGEWFGEVSALSGMASPAEYRARGRCVTLSLPRPELLLLLQASPTAAGAMLALIASTTSRLMEVVADTGGLGPPARVLAKLLSLSAPAAGGAERDACRLPVTQTELAELCSVSRATVRKVMEELEARGGVACSYAELYVLSRQSILHALRDHLRSGPVGRAAQYPTQAAD